MRSYCLYKGNYLDIADMYDVIDGKQINIPEKLKYYRQLSDTHSDLTCPCGCGEVVVLVAGSVRRQHFRLLKKFANTNCEYQEESDLSVKSKIVLKCWLSKNLPEIENEVSYRVPINELTDNNRRYEMTLYTKDYNFGIVYYRLSSNIEDEKIKLQNEYLETKILYVSSAENEFTDDQYPEHLMMIQERQGYCFFLNVDSNMVYEEVEAKVCVYMKNYKGYWKNVVVCEGFLNQYEIDHEGVISFHGNRITDLVRQTMDEYQKIQDNTLAQIRLAKKREEKEKQERLEQIRIAREEMERRRKEEQVRREEEQRQREIENAKKLERLKKITEEKAKLAEEEKRKADEEEARKKEEELKAFLQTYPKLAVIHSLLSEMEAIKGSFLSDQSNGKTKNYFLNINIRSVKINMKRHTVEVAQDNWNKAYFFVLEGDFTKYHKPGTGVAYTVLDYTRITDIDHHFKTAFSCVYRASQKEFKCAVPDIKCQFLDFDNACMCEHGCTYQRKNDIS